MEIVLVRHAQPDWEAGGRAVDDPGLTGLGHEQARRTAEALAGESFDSLLASPLKRADETSRPIAERLGLEVEVHSWLREIGLPPMAGKTTDEVSRYFARANARDLAQHWDGLPGGESFRHFYERVSAGIEGLLLGDHRLRIHEDAGHRLWKVPEEAARLLIVAHQGTCSVIVSHLLGIEPVPWSPLRFDKAWASISRLHASKVARGAVWSLGSFNRVEHLDGLDSC
ncbi:MAG: histidine phosphatase family protein [Myxococcota bacterium]